MRASRLGRGLLVAILVCGCGGNVVVDGGTGGSGAGGSSTSGPDALSLCQTICSFLSERCGEQDCEPTCTRLVTRRQECNDVAVAYLGCVSDNLNSSTCAAPEVCEALGERFGACVDDDDGNDCGVVECSGSSAGFCECKSPCAGRDLGVACGPEDGRIVCSCFEQGALVATCEEPGPSGCGFIDGCCAAIFFPPPPSP